VDGTGLAASVAVTDGVTVLTEVAVELRDRGITVVDLGLRRPTLDEAFLHLTGQTATAGAAEDRELAK
jgi:ABC-2 type transport system ATP-binding protein